MRLPRKALALLAMTLTFIVSSLLFIVILFGAIVVDIIHTPRNTKYQQLTTKYNN